MSWADLRRFEYKLIKKGDHLSFPFNVPRWVIWCFAIITFMVYSFVFYYFFVSPFSFRWKGLFGGTHPAGYSIRGIDISHYQGTIDWKQLKNANLDGDPVSFVIIKATEGTDFIDDSFNKNLKEAKENGLICGAYHFFLPSESAEKQAKYFLEQVKLEPGDFPPVLDIEHKGDLSDQQIRDAALMWLKIVEKQYKVKPIIYTNYNFKMKYLNDSVLDAYPYWIAHYYVDTLKYKGNWKLWQYTDNGNLEGVGGTVDFDLYNGSMYDLHKFLIGHREENEFFQDADE